MGDKKRTKDLTREEILTFNKKDLKHWMGRIMMRLYKLVDKATYNTLAYDFVAASKRSVAALKEALVKLVGVICEYWCEPQLDVVD